MQHLKYPRTPHFPWSPGATSDDRMLDNADHFINKEIVVTEKMDGESAAIYADGTHARSIDSRNHPSRSNVKRLQARLAPDLPENWRLAGENCHAVHSIKYSALPDWFLLFGIYEESDTGIYCLSWDDTVFWAECFGIFLVPVLYRGIWDEDMVKSCYTGVSAYGGEQEGYVVRLASGFRFTSFQESIAKYVRAGHVQTDEHWMHGRYEVNKLKDR